MAALFAGALALAGCGTATSPSPSRSSRGTPTVTSGTGDPVVAVQRYFDALNGDCATAYGLLSDDMRGAVGTQQEFCQAVASDPNASVTVGHVESSEAGRSRVGVQVTKPNGQTNDDLTDLILVATDWRIENIRSRTHPPDVSRLDMARVVTAIQAQYQQKTGHAITLTCPAMGTQDVTIGTVTLCSYATADGTSNGQIRVVAAPLDNYLWHTVDTSPSPLPSPSPS